MSNTPDPKGIGVSATSMNMKNNEHALYENTIVDVFDRCYDYDDDCKEICNKLECFLYSPENGYCPYLSGEIK